MAESHKDVCKKQQVRHNASTYAFYQHGTWQANALNVWCVMIYLQKVIQGTRDRCCRAQNQMNTA
jgi:hypothetical protein